MSDYKKMYYELFNKITDNRKSYKNSNGNRRNFYHIILKKQRNLLLFS